MPTHAIDATLCTDCGLCAAVCGCLIYEQTDDGVRVNEGMARLCFHCGHCMAMCPTQAVTVEGFDYADFREPGEATTAEGLLGLMLQRRSIRAFTDQPVPREVLQQIVDAAATAPMGIPPSGVEVTGLTMREQVAQIVPVSVKQIEQLAKMTGSRIGRFMLRRMMGSRGYREVVDCLLPLVGPGLRMYHEQGTDLITYDAPAMLLFHVGPDAVAGETDVVIAATHAMLMAEALGVGSIMLGFAQAAVAYSKELKARFGIPVDHEIKNALALGYARHSFKRSIPRQLRRVAWQG